MVRNLTIDPTSCRPAAKGELANLNRPASELACPPTDDGLLTFTLEGAQGII
eukprot:SAG11_NODE_7467_length_1139_cov_1.413462_1_plen_51_part_10